MQLKAVFFDKDGVLADIEALHAEAYARAFAKHGVAITAADFRRVVTIGGRRVTEWFRDLGGQTTDAELYQTKDEMYHRVSDGRVTPREGLISLISDLRAHGVDLYVTTGARRILAERLLEQFGIREDFAGILGLEDVRAVKPNPEIYVKALAVAGVTSAAAVVIEDMPRGVAAARGAGLAVVAAPTDPDEGLDFSNAQLVVRSLAELDAAHLDAVVRGFCSAGVNPTEGTRQL